MKFTVFADKNDIITSSRTGASQRVTQTEIESSPTIARSIHDYTRLSPLIISSTSDGSNVGGRNSRYNNIQVDGAILGDAFGLSSSGTPGGQAGAEAISLDAIQEFQVSIAPFDVRQGGFTGGLINAISRSGSNRFDGSVFLYGRNQNFVGDSPLEYQKVNVVKDQSGNIIRRDTSKSRNAYPDFNELQIGGRLGGPIIKDKLFFFASGEYKDRNDPFVLGLQGDNEANIFNVPKDTLALIKKIVKEKYNYDIGSYNKYTRNTGDVKLFLRLDYNLSDIHRLTLRHNFVSASQGSGVNRYSNEFSYDGTEYLFKSVQNQTVLQLNSLFNSTTSNELRLAYTSVRDKRDPESDPFPYVTIKGLGTDGKEYVELGVERYSQANELNQDIIELTDNFTYFLDNHTFTLGTTNQYVHFSNLFVQDLYGNYTFSSYNDFLNGTPSYYSLSYLLKNGNERAVFSYFQTAFYLQDEWAAMSNLKFTIGVRADMYLYPDDPANNAAFAAAFSGKKTSEMPSPIAFSPRVGFNWDVNSDKTFQLRGGIGLFSGRTPGVWIGNQYANTGLDYGRIDLNKNLPVFVSDPYNQPQTGLSSVKTSEINITDKNFKMPQVLRTNVAADYQLPYGFIGTVEFIYGKTINDILYQNINLTDSLSADGKQVYTIDGRPFYNANRSVVSKNFTKVIYLTNTDKGQQYSITAQLQKPFGQGLIPNLSLNFAYTYSFAEDVNSATSSKALSNWQYNHVTDPNNPEVTTSLFCIPNRILANVSYKLNWGSGYATTFGAFYEGRSGSPFSMLYYTQTSGVKWDASIQADPNVKDANNDDIWSNDVVYIPKDLQNQNGVWQDDKMILVNGANEWKYNNGKDSILIKDALDKFINSFDQLKDNRGKISKRYSLQQPWRHQLDIRITQDIPTFKGQKVQITFDVLNVLNLLNSDWGQSKYVVNNQYNMFRFEGYDKATGKIRASYIPNSRGISKNDIWEVSDFWSRWQMQLGIRYTF